jgi:hypothetical protein
MSACGRPTMLSPSNTISPDVGATAPEMVLNSVVFPAPFGPMMANSAPSSTSKLTALLATSPP